MTDAARWNRIKELFDAAFALPPRERDAFLSQACGRDAKLQLEVESLLAAHVEAGSFAQQPAVPSLDGLVFPPPADATRAEAPVLMVGDRLGPYEIVGALGAGGMGEVYRARDTRLGRFVALKVLSSELAKDPHFRARFEREARAIAALAHPHICTLHDIGHDVPTHAATAAASAGSDRPVLDYLVMEYLEGQTLAAALTHGPFSIARALRFAQQIAEALDAAHEKGITHRDLKPANIVLTRDDVVKVLDFGLAKMAAMPGDASGAASAGVSQSAVTDEHVVLGTAAYMSPEQARGQPVDKRTDIWAFGCVLYEMLTGRAAFRGPTMSDTIAAILERTPDWTALPAATPSQVRRLLERCLQKDPKRRLRDIGDASTELSAAPVGTQDQQRVRIDSGQYVGSRFSWKHLLLTAALGALGTLAIVISSALLSHQASAPSSRTMRFPLLLGEGQQFIIPSRRQIAISPDGGTIVYAANGRLYRRALADLEAAPIPGTDEGATDPEFSPDGLSLAFRAASDETIKRIGLNGGAATSLYGANVEGISWGPGGIVLQGRAQGGDGDLAILRVSPNGGEPETLVRIAPDEYVHGRPEMVNGEVLLFTRLTTNGFSERWEDTAEIVAQSIRTGERRVLLTGGSDARYLPTGHLVYAVGGALYAVQFDPTKMAIMGSPTRVVEGVRRGVTAQVTAHFAVSASGSLIYLPGPVGTVDQLYAATNVLVEVDRSGQLNPVRLSPGPYYVPRYSPDGRQVAFMLVGRDQRPRHIGIYDLSGTSAVRQLTLSGSNTFPLWSPNGQRVAFQSDREGAPGLFWQRSDGIGPAERLTTAESGTGHEPDSWSPDGQTLLFEANKDGQFSLWILSLRERKVERFGNVESRAAINAAFGPKGRWVAYGAGEGPASRVYIEPFPRTGDRYLVANEPARNPMWSPDGKELFYASGMDRFRVVSFATEPTVEFGNAALVPRGGLFEQMFGGYHRDYDLSPDGKRILGIISAQTAQQAIAPTIQVIANWSEELKQRGHAN